MAVGTVSGVDQSDNWQLVASQAMSGLNTYTFSSLTGYKTYWLVGKAITSGTSEIVNIRVNGDTSGGSYANLWASDGNGSGFQVTANIATTRAFSLQIDNADKAVPHQVRTNTYASGYPATPGDAYIDAAVITSLTVRTNGGSNFSGGTVFLYGIAA
jgi:hypothetical protein